MERQKSIWIRSETWHYTVVAVTLQQKITGQKIKEMKEYLIQEKTNDIESKRKNVTALSAEDLADLFYFWLGQGFIG